MEESEKVKARKKERMEEREKKMKEESNRE
jgi:hypothetical protein